MIMLSIVLTVILAAAMFGGAVSSSVKTLG
jgi:hypothetical protein